MLLDPAKARMRISAGMQILPQNLDRQARDFLLRLEEEVVVVVVVVAAAAAAARFFPCEASAC